jgi:3-oxoacyl-[acyl-carrier protein] reductase
MSRLDLSGRVALVTGGVRGIGRAIAEALAREGANVIVTARDLEKAESAASELKAAYGGDQVGFALEVRENEQVSAIGKAIFSRFKRLDILVNNAGILGDGLIGMVSNSTIEDTLAINVEGPIHLIQMATRLMRRNNSGSIINISSIIGTRGNRGQIVYAASKSAVIGMTLAAAKELAPQGIRVNAVAPGYIQTDMIAHLPSEIHQERLRSIGMGRVGQPSEIADTVLFLASDLSQYVTGQIIGVDGCMVI